MQPQIRYGDITVKKLIFIASFVFFGVAHAQSPTITSFDPTSGSTGTEVTITGTNFGSNIKVAAFGAEPTGAAIGTAGINLNIVSSTEIKVTVPPGMSLGVGKIALWNDVAPQNAQVLARSSGDFTVDPLNDPDPPPPTHTITGLNPDFGPVGTKVTISGTGFNDQVTVVAFGTAQADFEIISPNRIDAFVPSTLSAFDAFNVFVAKGGSVAQSSANFTVTSGSATPAPNEQESATPALPVPVNGFLALLLMIIGFLAAASLVVRRGKVQA